MRVKALCRRNRMGDLEGESALSSQFFDYSVEGARRDYGVPGCLLHEDIISQLVCSPERSLKQAQASTIEPTDWGENKDQDIPHRQMRIEKCLGKHASAWRRIASRKARYRSPVKKKTGYSFRSRRRVLRSCKCCFSSTIYRLSLT